MGTRKDLLFTENQKFGLVYKMFYYEPQTIKHGFHLALTSGNIFWLTLVSQNMKIFHIQRLLPLNIKRIPPSQRQVETSLRNVSIDIAPLKQKSLRNVSIDIDVLFIFQEKVKPCGTDIYPVTKPYIDLSNGGFGFATVLVTSLFFVLNDFHPTKKYGKNI